MKVELVQQCNVVHGQKGLMLINETINMRCPRNDKANIKMSQFEVHRKTRQGNQKRNQANITMSNVKYHFVFSELK